MCQQKNLIALQYSHVPVNVLLRKAIQIAQYLQQDYATIC